MTSKAATNPSSPAPGGADSSRGDASLVTRYGLPCLIGLTAVAALLRTLYLTSKSFTLDEGFTAFLARTSYTELAHTVWHSEPNLALYYGLLRLWTHLGSGEFTMRLLSVAFGVATIPMIYVLGLRLFNRRTAIVAALLMVVHPAHVALSQDARSYSLTVLLVSFSSLLFLRTLENPSRLNWIAYATISALAVYSHFFAALVILAQALSLLAARLDRPVWNALLKAAPMMAALLAPVAVFLLIRPRTELAWVPALHRQQVFDLLYFLTLSKFRCLLYVALWMAALWGLLSRPNRHASRWPCWFVLSWLVVPIAVTILASTVRPLLVERFLAICIPASVLLAAAGFEFLLVRHRMIAGAVLLLLLLYSARSLRFFYAHPDINDDWRGAITYVLAQSHPADEIVVLPAYARFTFDYYRATIGPQAPLVRVTSDPSSGLTSTPPQTVWFIGSDFPVKGATEAQVNAFLAAHPEDCAASAHQFTAVRVWQLRPCSGR
jgi:hypothetical protein